MPSAANVTLTPVVPSFTAEGVGSCAIGVNEAEAPEMVSTVSLALGASVAVYAVPFVRPVKVQLLLALNVIVQVAPPGVATIVIEVGAVVPVPAVAVLTYVATAELECATTVGADNGLRARELAAPAIAVLPTRAIAETTAIIVNLFTRLMGLNLDVEPRPTSELTLRDMFLLRLLKPLGTSTTITMQIKAFQPNVDAPEFSRGLKSLNCKGFPYALKIVTGFI
jgi:hypothetical protein